MFDPCFFLHEFLLSATYLVLVPAEEMYILLDPFQSGSMVMKTQVQSPAIVGCMDEAPISIYARGLVEES